MITSALLEFYQENSSRKEAVGSIPAHILVKNIDARMNSCTDSPGKQERKERKKQLAGFQFVGIVKRLATSSKRWSLKS